VACATEILLGDKDTGESVVIIGGGLVGSETALYLAQKGKKVTIVEILPAVMPGEYWSNRSHMLKLMADTQVEIFTETAVQEINDDGVVIIEKNTDSRTLPADSVLLACGLQPTTSGLLDTLQESIPEVYAIGDCVGPRKVRDAIWEGFRKARLI